MERLIRAIEIYRISGVTMTEQIARSKSEPSPYDACEMVLSFRNRQTLYDRIDRRVDDMMKAGLLEEAKRVLAQGSRTALQAIGYKEFLPCFRGECPLSEAVEQIKKESRHYAKRQLTWFRRDENAEWIFIDDFPDFGAVCRRAFETVKRKGWRI